MFFSNGIPFHLCFGLILIPQILSDLICMLIIQPRQAVAWMYRQTLWNNSFCVWHLVWRMPAQTTLHVFMKVWMSTYVKLLRWDTARAYSKLSPNAIHSFRKRRVLYRLLGLRRSANNCSFHSSWGNKASPVECISSSHVSTEYIPVKTCICIGLFYFHCPCGIYYRLKG